MKTEVKIIAGGIIFTIIAVVGFIFWQANTPTVDDHNTHQLPEISGVEISNQTSDWGKISMAGGIVTREFELKNTSGGTLKLRTIATSCMCTTAAVQVNGKNTRFFGMEGHGDKNPPVNLEIGTNDESKVIIKYDPAAHGPQGVGPFSREVFLTFSQPQGVTTITFTGKVIP